MRLRNLLIGLVLAAGLIIVMWHGSALMNKQRANEIDATEAADVGAEMLQAFADNDYAVFSSRFTDAYAEELDEPAFEAWRTPLVDSLGSYLGIVEQSEPKPTSTGAMRYVFHAAFDGDDSVQFAFVTKPGTSRINRVELKPEK